MISVTQASPADKQRIGYILGQAFVDDPVMRYLFPATDWYGRYFADVFARYYCRKGESYLTDSQQAAALWLAPGVKTGGPSLGFSAAWIGAMLSHQGPRITAEAIKMKLMYDQIRPLDHMYLHAIGVLPEHKGKGLGGALMRAVLSRCDKNGTSVWLENSKEANLGFYESFGFKVCKEYRVLGKGPYVWFMSRQID